MQKDRSFWPEWARFLQQSGLSELVVALLEAAGPLNSLIGQMIYAARPFLGSDVSANRLQALAGLFEDQHESRSFAAYLREEKSG